MTPGWARMTIWYRHLILRGICLHELILLMVVLGAVGLKAENALFTDTTNVWPGEEMPLTNDIPDDYVSLIQSIDGGAAVQIPGGLMPEWLDKQKNNIQEDYASLSRAEKVLSEIQSLGRVLAKLDGRSLVKMPFAIKGTFDEQAEFMLGFNKVSLHPDYASFDVAAKVRFPFMDTTMYFVATDLKYNNRSGLVGNTKLMLVQDYVYEINSGKSALILRGYRPKSNKGSFIEIDCDGIKAINLGLEFIFNPDYLQPVNARQEFVKTYTDFSYSRESWFIIQGLNLPPFYFKDFRHAYFTLENLAVDLDEKRTTIPFIRPYLDSMLREGVNLNTTLEEWTGFYGGKFSLTLGKNVARRKDGAPITIAAENMVIDEAGFTALVSLQKELLTLNDGSAGGWPISINTLVTQIVADQVKKFGFGGGIFVPVFGAKGSQGSAAKGYPVGNITTGKEVPTGPAEETACVKYLATYDLDKKEVSLAVQKMDTNDLILPIVFADVNIREGSYLTLTAGDEFKIEAFLNADVVMKGAISASHSAGFAGVQFQGLWVSNQKPFLNIQSIRPVQDTTGNLGKFPLTFKQISLSDYQPAQYNQQVKQLVIDDLSLDFGEMSQGNALRATTSMSIFFGVKDFEGSQQWVNKGFEINKIRIEGTLPGVKKIVGEVLFYQDHPDYGAGFGGAGVVEFNFQPLTLSMACMFGSTGDTGFDYSYVDAAIDVSKTNKPSSSEGSGFQVQMLMAGYFKNMVRQDLSEFKVGYQTASSELQLGGLFPENAFKPAEGSKGIKGGLIAKVGNGAIFGLRVIFEENKSEGQGTATRFFMEGLVEIMPKENGQSIKPREPMPPALESTADLKNQEPPASLGGGAFGGFVRVIVVNNAQGRTLNAQLGVHGTMSSLTVKAYAEYYHSPNGWHLFIGRPETRIALGYGFEKNSDVVSGGITFNAYIMMGNEGMPTDLPKPYSNNAFNSELLDDAFRRLSSQPGTNIFSNNALSDGKAFAFGAGVSLNVNFGIPEKNPTLGINAGADLGMDLLLTPSLPECNLEGESEPGFKGWYMYGQLYAAISATILLNKFTIFNGGAAALIQGAFVNPTWGVGTWTFAYKVLWISGEAQGVFKFGKPCQDFNTPISPDEIIAAVYPNRPAAENAASSRPVISINSDLLVDLKLPVNRTEPLTVTNFEAGKSETYNLRADARIQVHNQRGQTISGDLFVLNDGYTVAFKPQAMLTPGDELTMDLVARVVDQSSRSFTLDGDTFIQDTVLHFLVDPEGLLGLRTEDVDISYPVHRQKYFHIEEHPQMMLSYGKTLPVGSYTISSHLYRDGETTELQKSTLTLSGTNFVQPRFSALAASSSYQWVIKLTTPEGKSATIADIAFSTSQYKRFQDKMGKAVIHGPAIFSPDTSGRLDLIVTAQEPLEVLVKNNYAPAHLKTNAPAQYFAQPWTWFDRKNTYGYFAQVYDQHVPYGLQNIVATCDIDDASVEGQRLAKPADKNQMYAMPDYVSRPLRFTGTTITYDIYQDFVRDFYVLRQLKPPVPPHYAQCSDYGLGVLPPVYQPGAYALMFRYFIPGFNQYSSSSTLIPFNLGR